MKDISFAAIFDKLKGVFNQQNKLFLKDEARKAAMPFLVSSVFLITIWFLVYNSVNAVTIWSQESGASQTDFNFISTRKTTDSLRAMQMKRPEASIYRNGRDISGGILFPIFPVHGGRLTGNYGMRGNPFDEYGFAEFHAGLDVAAPLGTPVVAAGKGTVTFSGADGGYGNVVIIEHADGKVTTRYAHLARCDVSAGDVVVSGQQIGLVGSTGRSTGPHLHYEVRIDGKTVDPRLVYPSK
ncbi:MAG: M23 family metallopeptidase [Acidobacteriota bacterium]|nr:M23 family metallopeptidase [Acidobacteriota bacterium]